MGWEDVNLTTEYCHSPHSHKGKQFYYLAFRAKDSRRLKHITLKAGIPVGFTHELTSNAKLGLFLTINDITIQCHDTWFSVYQKLI